MKLKRGLALVTSARDPEAIHLLSTVVEQSNKTENVTVSVIVAAVDSNSHQLDGVRTFARASETPFESIEVPRRRTPAGEAGSNEWRGKYELQLTQALSRYRVDLIFLCGYMLIAGDNLLDFRPMLNLHPALPGGPVGGRAKVVAELVRTRPPVVGAMIHWATSDLDRGPAVLTICAAPPTHDISENDLNRLIVTLEPALVASMVSLLDADLISTPGRV